MNRIYKNHGMGQAINLAVWTAGGGITKVGQGAYAAEASTLDWEPGRWPATIEILDGARTRTLRAVDQESAEGDLMSVTYADGRGIALKVFND